VADFSWTPPLAILALGAVAGAVLVARGRQGSKPASPGDGSAQADLRREYDAVIRRLAEGANEEERAALEVEAARILKRMDSPVPPGADASAPETAARQTKSASALTGFLYGALSMLVLGGLVFFAFQGASERPAGGSPTGGGMAGGGSGGPSTPEGGPTDAEVTALEKAVSASPRDVDLKIELTRAYLQRRDLMKVFDTTKQILEVEPGNAHGLTYQALVRVAMGQADQAEPMLLQALAKDPGIEDTYIYLAVARLQLNNRQGAEQAIRDAQRQFPGEKEELEHVFSEIVSSTETSASSAGVDHPEIATGAAPTPVASGSGPGLVVAVELARGVSVPEGAVLFVIVREAGFDTGPPVAVKRVAARGFPITLTISDRDSMAGESLPGLVRLDARIDLDGDPLTKDPKDPSANEDNVRPGGGQTLLVLTPGG